jgi:LPLT family lysophospholipid transporter-like MFS transporter
VAHQGPHRAICFTPRMKKGFYTIMSAQFFSSLADNALLVGAIDMLQATQAPEWQVPALAPMFALFYVLLAPFVGAFADALPKGRVMFIANGIKVLGCLMMLWGAHPLGAYAVVGLGAAAYSPAKYGILTELLPPSQLVKANGWIEGLTIASIVMGVMLGGALVSQKAAALWTGLEWPGPLSAIDTSYEAAIAITVLLYAAAAAFNLRIPRTRAALQPMPRSLTTLGRDFFACNLKLWRDKLGQVSLASTTLLWGISGNLRVIVFAWAAAALSYTTAQASGLVGVVVIGTALGAIAASWLVRLEHAPRVLVLGVLMGLLLLGLNVIRDVWVAAPFLVLLGLVGGFLVVPMNALLQHRGHSLMGAGRSIAVQNFNEQACILVLGALYTGLTGFGLSAFAAITVFGLGLALLMAAVARRHQRNLREHPEDMRHLHDDVARGGQE